MAGPTVYLNDRFLDANEPATVSLFDRGYLVGDGIFETLRTYHGVPFRLDTHLQRLAHSLDVLQIHLKQSLPDLRALAVEAVARSGLQDTNLRITVSRGEGPSPLSLVGADSPTLSIVVREVRAYPAEAYSDGIESMVVKSRHIPAACIDPAVKSNNYLPSILARRELDARGMQEGIMLAVEGHVCSGTSGNVFMVKDGVLSTPDLDSPCLPGVTRAAVLESAASWRMVALERRITVEELLSADEVFFTNSIAELLPVRSIDGHRFDAGANTVTATLSQTFRELVDRETA
jgi:branched-chain amino acid aminotransferase